MNLFICGLGGFIAGVLCYRWVCEYRIRDQYDLRAERLKNYYDTREENRKFYRKKSLLKYINNEIDIFYKGNDDFLMKNLNIGERELFALKGGFCVSFEQHELERLFMIVVANKWIVPKVKKGD